MITYVEVYMFFFLTFLQFCNKIFGITMVSRSRCGIVKPKCTTISIVAPFLNKTSSTFSPSLKKTSNKHWNLTGTWPHSSWNETTSKNDPSSERMVSSNSTITSKNWWPMVICYRTDKTKKSLTEQIRHQVANYMLHSRMSVSKLVCYKIYKICRQMIQYIDTIH